MRSSLSVILSSGKRLRISGSTVGNRNGAIVGMTPKRIVAVMGLPVAPAYSTKSSDAAKISLARSRTSKPIGVMDTFCRSRSTKWIPNASSNSFRPALKVDWPTKQA